MSSIVETNNLSLADTGGAIGVGPLPFDEFEEKSLDNSLDAESHDSHVAGGDDEEREYGCKYCHKKFTNKQALGGHQNAHKIERAVEKNTRERNMANFGYTPSYPNTNSLPFQGSWNKAPEFLTSLVRAPDLSSSINKGPNFSGSYNRASNFINRSMINRQVLSPPMQMQQGLAMRIGHFSRPIITTNNEPSVNHGYYGWTRPMPTNVRFAPYPVAARMTINQHARNYGFGASSSSNAKQFKVSNGGEGNDVQVLNSGNQQNGNSDLDLSLKL